MEGYIGTMSYFAANFAPKNWAYCQGQLLPISQNQALFSLLGTTYGGNGVQTFGLPDARGRLLVGAGQGQGLAYYALGEMTGYNTVTLNIANLPQHTHTVMPNVSGGMPVNSAGADSDTPGSNFFGNSAADAPYSALPVADPQPSGTLSVTTQVGVAGGSMPVSVTQPYLGMNHIVCMYGLFPSRN